MRSFMEAHNGPEIGGCQHLAEDKRNDYGQPRCHALGRVGDGAFMVAFTWRGEAHCIINAWRVNDDSKRRYSAETLRAERAHGDTASRADAPVYPVGEAFWRDAKLTMPRPGKASVHLRLDTDVLAWFWEQGRGHLSRMNAVLRSFMEAHKG
jgi:uncharacterized protein (DUF4415 family)